MSKERLEEMKELWDLGYTKFVPYLFDYASEQAERVQELEKELTYYKMATESYLSMEQENKLYREALEEIDDIMRLKLRCCKEDMHIMNALKALEGEE